MNDKAVLDHPCKYEAEINVMLRQVNDLHKAFYGNGSTKECLLVEIDRNIQFRTRAQRWNWLILSSVVTVPFVVVTGMLIWFFRG